MEQLSRRADALLLEDFDIKRDAELTPEKIVGVRINRIYTRIAQIRKNPLQKEQLLILINVLDQISDEQIIEPTYVPMTVKDISQCFSTQLKRLPKSTFIEMQADFVGEQRNSM